MRTVASCLCGLKLWSRGLLLFPIWFVFLCGQKFIGLIEPEVGELLQDQEVKWRLIGVGRHRTFRTAG